MNKKLLLALKFNETDHSNECNKKVIKKKPFVLSVFEISYLIFREITKKRKHNNYLKLIIYNIIIYVYQKVIISYISIMIATSIIIL